MMYFDYITTSIYWYTHNTGLCEHLLYTSILFFWEVRIMYIFILFSGLFKFGRCRDLHCNFGSEWLEFDGKIKKKDNNILILRSLIYIWSLLLRFFLSFRHSNSKNGELKTQEINNERQKYKVCDLFLPIIECGWL